MKDNMTTSTFSPAEYDAILEQQRRNDQRLISALCKKVGDSYGQMAHFGKLMHENQRDLQKKQEEQSRLYKVRDLLLKGSSSSRGDSVENGLLRASYYMLPVLDVIFAWLALKPIMISKLADYGEAFAETAGLLLSVAVGFGISLLSRFAMPALDDMKWWKLPWIALSVCALPMMYVISEITFNGGRSWVFSGCFACISFLIQLSIVFLYRKHIGALQQKKDGSADIRKTVRRSEKALRKDVKRLQSQARQIKKDFRRSLDEFTGGFKDVAERCERYANEYGQRPSCMLGLAATWLGNEICYQREALPLNGDVSSVYKMPFVKDLEYIGYMYGGTAGDASLDEYLSSIDEQRGSTYSGIAA